jgi:hypothetical protein
LGRALLEKCRVVYYRDLIKIIIIFYGWERGETRTVFWWESPKEKDHLKDQGVDGAWVQNRH